MTQSNLTSAANSQRLEAITTAERPLLIITDPGSGKTFTLVERINILDAVKLTPFQTIDEVLSYALMSN